jgi:hypothetical protein
MISNCEENLKSKYGIITYTVTQEQKDLLHYIMAESQDESAGNESFSSHWIPTITFNSLWLWMLKL